LGELLTSRGDFELRRVPISFDERRRHSGGETFQLRVKLDCRFILDYNVKQKCINSRKLDSGNVRKTLLEVTDRGVVTIPKALRGNTTLYEARRGEGGIIELVPQRAIPESQAWFWTERWQNMEREADADKAAGRVRHFGDAEAFLKALDAD
jgi:antitoxin MazE